MKRKIFFAFIFSFAVFICKGQDVVPAVQNKNVLKTNLLSPLSLYYERVLKKKTSILVGVKYIDVNFGSGATSSDPSGRYKNICLLAEYRWYSIGSKEAVALEGWYLAPFLRYKNDIIPVWQFTEVLAPGLEMGYQTNQSKKLMINYFIQIHQPFTNMDDNGVRHPAGFNFRLNEQPGIRVGLALGYLF